MIDLREISKLPVSPAVKKFMTEYGQNHVALLKGQAAEPKMKSEVELVEQQLAFALQEKKSITVAQRLLGRLRRLHSFEENEALGQLFGKKEDRSRRPPVDLGVLG